MNAERLIRMVVRRFGMRFLREAMKDRGMGQTEGARKAGQAMKVVRRIGRGLK